MTTPRVTVPVEPTEAMLEVLDDAAWFDEGGYQGQESSADTYRKLLAAAPAAPQAAGVGEIAAAMQRIEAVSLGGDVPEVYGAESFAHPNQTFRGDLRAVLSALRAQPQAREDAQPVSWEPEWTRTGTDVDGDPIQLKTRWGEFTGRATLARGGDRKWGAHINYGGGKLFDHGTSEDTVKAWLETEIRRRVSLEVARANTALALYTHPAPDALRVAVEALERIATVDMGGGFLGAQACRQVATKALSDMKANQKGGA